MLQLFERILYDIIILTKYFRITKNDELKKKEKKKKKKKKKRREKFIETKDNSWLKYNLG